jgi:hypothetical protein
VKSPPWASPFQFQIDFTHLNLGASTPFSDWGSPFALYKDIDAVMEAQRDLVDVVHTLKQVVCVKG